MSAVSNSNSSGKPTKPTESIGDRLDAAVIGLAGAVGVVYWTSQQKYVQEFDFQSTPLIHGEYYHTLPLASIALYLVMVHILDPWWRAQTQIEPPQMTLLLQAWNLILSFFSLCMLLGMGIPLAQFAIANGPYEMLCDGQGQRWSGPLYFWLFLFIMSKYAELFDTVLLIVRRKPNNFLHWYHHTTVLAYSWYAGSSRYSPGWFFGPVNCTVHTIMYWYYFRSACGVRLTYDKFITTIQITQMVAGILISGLWAYFHVQDPASCPADKPYELMTAGVIMYASYLFLFAAFYINRYLKGGNKGKKAE